MSIVEIKGKKALLFDTSVKHSEKCKCKNCRNNKLPPKTTLLIPIDIKNYIPIFVVNPFISFIFISKIYDIFNGKYLEANFDITDTSINSIVLEMFSLNFSKEFVNCINLLGNRDIFNAIGYFEENINNLSEFEMLYLSLIINFYVQNYEKSYENGEKAYKLLFNTEIKEDLNISSEISETILLFIFDFMVISLFSKRYDTFQKLLSFLIKTESIFVLYTFLFLISLFYHIRDNYVLLENIELVKENFGKVINSFDFFENQSKIKSYILFLFMCLSIYRKDIYNILSSEINFIAHQINSQIDNIEDYEKTLQTCIDLDNDNILYKLALYAINKNAYKDLITALEFLPLNKILANFVEYLKCFEIIRTKLLFLDKDINLNSNKLKEFMESESNNPFYWFINGLYYFSNKEFDAANNYFRGAVTTDNTFTEARIYFAVTSFLTGNIEKSLKIFENSLSNYDDFLYDIVLLNLSVIYKILGNEEFLKNIPNEIVNLETIEIFNNLIKES
ncbi:MAG: tetratricopeptide repeat protein [bacterium]